MSVQSEIAYAKINLALHVRARRPDGYHALETLFAFAEDGDRLTAEPADGLHLSICGPFAKALTADDDNLVLRAARALQAHFGVTAGAKIKLEKNLPVASGIGGGSADAAAAARLLARLWSCAPASLASIIAPLGADIPACVESNMVIGVGTGTELSQCPGDPLTGAPLLLINPRVELSTSSVFARWDGVDRGGLTGSGASEIVRSSRNDLEASAISLVPEIAQQLLAVQHAGATLTRMSGSGATCFGLFETAEARDSAAETISKAHPGWWMMASRLR